MSILDNLGSLFSGRKKTTSGDPISASELAIEAIFAYLKVLISTESLPKNLFDRYEEAKKLSHEEYLNSSLALYFQIEDFIVKNRPPVVKKVFDKKSLRDSVWRHISIEQLEDKFELVFLPEDKQNILLFESGIPILSEYVIVNLGIVRLQDVFSKSTGGTVLQPVLVKENGIDFQVINTRLASIQPSDVIYAFKALYSGLYTEIASSSGTRIANEKVRSVYEAVRRIYDQELASKFLMVLPEAAFQENMLR